jgi:hypothetical protein
MEDNVGEYEELEDDFLFMANEGKPAIVAQDDGRSSFKNKKSHD